MSFHRTARILLAFCLFSIALGLFLFLPTTESAFATDYTVGGPCGTTIQACINYAANGDTINIPAGTYTESLTLNKAISLTGVLSSTTLIHAVSNQRVITVTGSVISNSVVISGLTIYGGNTSSVGAGMAVINGAQIQLTNVMITNNVSSDFGGGIFVDSTDALTMMNTQILSNTTTGVGTSGGGIHNYYGTLTVINSVFKNNRSLNVSGGGGIFNSNILTMTNSTLSNNSAPASGGGGIGIAPSVTTTLRNTIIANSPSGGNCAGTINTSVSNLQWNPSSGCTSFSTGDPKLAPLGNYRGPTQTMGLYVGSAAIDVAAADANCPSTDQRGVLRPQGAHCDIGAFEGTLYPLYLPIIEK